MALEALSMRKSEFLQHLKLDTLIAFKNSLLTWLYFYSLLSYFLILTLRLEELSWSIILFSPSTENCAVFHSFSCQ